MKWIALGENQRGQQLLANHDPDPVWEEALVLRMDFLLLRRFYGDATKLSRRLLNIAQTNCMGEYGASHHSSDVRKTKAHITAGRQISPSLAENVSSPSFWYAKHRTFLEA